MDLGLDVKWALTNIGAENPEDYGDYFAWGETEPYYESIAPDGTVTWKAGISNGYDWGAYFDTKDGGNSFIDYATDKKTVLDPADDAATVNWGEPWRIPTAEEWEALLNADDFDREWSENPLGAIFTSKIPGYEGRQIFLPVTGFWYNKDYVDDEAGNYWSSSLYGPIPGDAKCFYFEDIESKMHTSYYYRISGYSVRPVCD